VNAKPNWWDDFFEGPAVAMWLQAIGPDQTNKETERLARLLAIPPGSAVLDVPCGAGRIALALAERGYRITGVDWSREFLGHARAADRANHVTWERRDMRDLPSPARFDGAVCVGNSFGYLDDAGNADFLRAVRAALKPGARFVLETPMVLENLTGHLQQRPWWKAGDVYLLVENQYDHTTSRLEIEYTFVSNGEVHVRRGSHRAYTYRQLVDLIAAAGFEVQLSEPYTHESRVLTFIATAA
jgi:cyclopropane fatty-acyl-phospholipid synthase-like methyltransferase